MSDKTASELRKEIVRLQLRYPSYFLSIDDASLEAIWNGYGPDDWPEILRDFVTWLYRNFECCALPHDVRFAFSDGTIEGCKTANQEMFFNLHKMLSLRYPLSKPWLYPLRAWAWAKITIAERALSTAACYEAYYQAYKAGKKEV